MSFKLAAFARPEAPAFLVLFTLDTLARAMIMTVVPLQAYAVLGNAQQVSVLYFVAGTIGLCGSLSVPCLVTRIHRRVTFTPAFVGWIVAMGLLAQPYAWALVTGLALQLFAGAAVTICLNRYVLDNVPQARLTRFEPIRMFLAGIGCITGPVAGVYLSTRLASWAPFLLSTGFFLAMYVYFRVRAATRWRLDHRPIRRNSCDGFFKSRAWHSPGFCLWAAPLVGTYSIFTRRSSPSLVASVRKRAG